MRPKANPSGPRVCPHERTSGCVGKMAATVLASFYGSDALLSDSWALVRDPAGACGFGAFARASRRSDNGNDDLPKG
jgi:hypothetical protein